ncbi:ferredoxin [Winogradskya consettensis]|uniref:Ferredoxin n=1 Tax=Winogradskya consettensis TaxID=113560 RepID=A0A919T0R6_9ACTN|nr:ferredoxin [Actinoplanes consettensis]GIM82102.1 ferredoxin [Actinoplanes consettensis]
MSTRIIANRDRCVGAGQCVLVDPDAFDQDDSDGLVVLIHSEPHSDDEVARAREAVNVCPGRALSLAE